VNASPGNSSVRELFPPLHVGDSLFVALDDDFGALLDRFAVIGSRAGATPNSAIEKMISPVPLSRIGMLMVPSEPSIR